MYGCSGVVRICCEEGQIWILCHGALMIDFRAGCSSCSMTNSFATNAVLIERAVSCWHLHQLISQTTQYLDSWLSDLLQSELKMKLLKVEGHVSQCALPPAGDATVRLRSVSRILHNKLNWTEVNSVLDSTSPTITIIHLTLHQPQQSFENSPICIA